MRNCQLLEVSKEKLSVRHVMYSINSVDSSLCIEDNCCIFFYLISSVVFVRCFDCNFPSSSGH